MLFSDSSVPGCKDIWVHACRIGILDASSLIRLISTSQEQLGIVSKDVVFFSLFIYFPTPSLI